MKRDVALILGAIKAHPVVTVALLALGFALLLAGGCACLGLGVLHWAADMRGPRGYYSQVGSPSTFIEFFEKPRARSNIIPEFGDAEYTFSAFDGEINMHGPLSAPKEKQRHLYIYGEGAQIRIQDLTTAPMAPDRKLPITDFVRTLQPNTGSSN